MIAAAQLGAVISQSSQLAIEGDLPSLRGAEFSFEMNAGNGRQATLAMKIDYPIALDSDRKFEIEFLDAGVEAFPLTFGLFRGAE